jgi:signal transduction histidine kinase
MALEEKTIANILLIDDDYSICTGITGLLETMGFSANYALSAKEGMLYLHTHPEVDVVLLDINLGDKNGIDILPEIKKNFKSVQVMMFTSHNSMEFAIECMKRGAADYLVKPFNEEEFLHKIQFVLAKRNLEKLNNLYLGILIHDFKIPLQCIIGAWELLKKSFSEQFYNDNKKILEIFDSGIFQIKNMINNLLSISKFETSTFISNYEKFNVLEEVEKVIKPVKLQIDSSNREFGYDFDKDSSLVINSNKDLYTRVLLNLVINAYNYTPEKGKIIVSFKHLDNGYFQTKVFNSGTYISDEEKEIIFDKFASAKLTQTSCGIRNFGLGLTFCKLAVEAMNGKIYIESQKEPAQTTFIFNIKNQE